VLLVLLAGVGVVFPGAGQTPSPGARANPLADTLPFRHGNHEGLACTSCHGMEPDHGTVTVRSIEDCQSCHHAPPTAGDCAACHTVDEVEGSVHRLTRSFRPTVAEATERIVPFRHGDHRESSCGTCHTRRPLLDAAELDCSTCHQDHHAPRTACLDCHRPAPEEAHDRSVHLGCGGAGCHTEVPVEFTLEGRDACSWCHTEMVDHEPDQACASCHILPPLRLRGGETPP